MEPLSLLHGGIMHKINILIIEDESMVALEIKREVEKLGYHVSDSVSSYTEALESIQKTRPDIMLVDIQLKGDKSGIDLVATVQTVNPIPHIYLTADEREETILAAAATNPAAYLNKPFKRETLRSNLLLIIHKLREYITPSSKLLPLGEEYFYDLHNQTALHNQEPIYLSINEKQLLKLLVEAKGAALSSKTIEQHIWGSFSPVSESALRTLVYRLRNKLKALEIETITGYGYRLIL